MNSYFDFVEEGQLAAAYPAAIGRDVVIDVVTRYPLSPQGSELLSHAAKFGEDIIAELRPRAFEFSKQKMPAGLPAGI